MSTIEDLIKDMRAEQTFLGPDRASAGTGGEQRWDRYERVIRYLEAQQIGPADQYHAMTALRLMRSHGGAGNELAEHLQSLLIRLNVIPE